ncbi:putative transcription factor Hap3/NF-YB family [Helianthus annuus]|nr:putative transcription factor Hap3/NF-YB family [Helianthus annuus]
MQLVPGPPLQVAVQVKGTEASNHLLGNGKFKIWSHRSVDPNATLDPEVEELLLMLADEFIDSVRLADCTI